MKQFKNVAEWLKSNPSDEEVRKVILLINKGAVNQTRKEIWEKESYIRQLQTTVRHFGKLNLTLPKDLTDAITKTKKEIEILSKNLPAKVVRAKAEKVEKKEEEVQN